MTNVEGVLLARLVLGAGVTGGAKRTRLATPPPQWAYIQGTSEEGGLRAFEADGQEGIFKDIAELMECSPLSQPGVAAAQFAFAPGFPQTPFSSGRPLPLRVLSWWEMCPCLFASPAVLLRARWWRL